MTRRHLSAIPATGGDRDGDLEDGGGADPVTPVTDGAAPAGTRVPVVVEVALIPMSINIDSSVVEVALVPVTDLKSVTSTHIPHVSYPKPSRVERAIVQTARRTLDERKLVAWAFEVKSRDQWRDRRTGARLLRTMNLDPHRAEAHHLVAKEIRAVRYDVRNGITLSYETHWAVERGELKIVGTAWFTVGGVTYIDATAPVRFRRG